VRTAARARARAPSAELNFYRLLGQYEITGPLKVESLSRVRARDSLIDAAHARTVRARGAGASRGLARARARAGIISVAALCCRTRNHSRVCINNNLRDRSNSARGPIAILMLV